MKRFYLTLATVVLLLTCGCFDDWGPENENNNYEKDNEALRQRIDELERALEARE